MDAIEIDGILCRQPCRLRQPRHDAERGPGREPRDRRQTLPEQPDIATKLVDDEAVDPRQFIRRQNQVRTRKACDDAATIDVSLKMGELSLLPAVRKADGDTLIVADGTSCRHQIHDGTGRAPLHVARVLAMSVAAK